MPPTSRRTFLTGSLLGLAGAALPGGAVVQAIEPFRRTGRPRMALSLAAYSFREYFQHGPHRRGGGPSPERMIDLPGFIDFCADHGCAGAELTSYYFPPGVGRDELLRLRRHAFLKGVAISGTAVGNIFTWPRGEKRDQEIQHVKQWIDRAEILGAPHIRIFAGNLQAGMSLAEAKTLCAETIRECCDYAGSKGIFLGLENHGGIVAEPADLLDLLRSVDSPWFGLNLDTGNFHTEDPYADLARCAPFAVNAQVKIEIQKRGSPSEPADFGRLVRLLRDANYQGYVALEYEAAENPWDAVPRILRALRPLLAQA
jgi:sugar phosphate isomerase/epimerase